MILSTTKLPKICAQQINNAKLSEYLIEHPQPMYAEHILVFIAAKNELRLEYLCYFLKCFLYDL